MKIGNFEVFMQDKKETSNLVAIAKTVVFFAVIIGFFVGFVILSGMLEKPVVEKSGTYKNLEISTLSNFEYTKLQVSADENSNLNTQIPENIMKMNGQKVAITGYMMPVRIDDQGNIEEFALNGNYDMCFYGAPSSLNQWVHVRMQEGVKAKFSHNLTTVFGTLEVGELIEDGEVISIYRLSGDKTSAETKKRF